MNQDIKSARPAVSVIVPTLNEEQSIARTLEGLAHLRRPIEVIVVDGGSDDLTTEIALRSGARVITSDRGRGVQMHNGALSASGQILLFLHADTTLPSGAIDRIVEALERDGDAVGGNFDITFAGNSRAALFMTWLYPKLERIGLSYGDSCIFVRASIYADIGGFKPFPIFEDVDLVQRLKKRGRMIHLPIAVVTSSRRFEEKSFAITFARWSTMQALYWIGIPPNLLDRLYAPIRSGRMTYLHSFQSVERNSP